MTDVQRTMRKSEDGENESTCPYCLGTFSARSTGGKRQVFCGASCRHRFQSDPLRHFVDAPPANPSGGERRRCAACNEEFLTRKRGGGRRQKFCSDSCCSTAYSRRTNRRSLLVRYGMTPGDYERLLEKQGGKCAVCKRAPKNNCLSVDHDHRTGSVRGLLCAPCNRHVGYFERHGAETLAYLSREPTPFVARGPENQEGV